MALQAGDRAPDFTVFSRPKEELRLGDYIGKQPVVLLFMPLAFSSTCTREMCTVAEDYASYSSLGAQVFGVTVDSPYVNQKWAEDCGAPFPILSDFNKQATALYGVLRADLNGLKGVAERAAFVIDRSGKIVYAWVGENPGVFPPLEEIKAAVKETVTESEAIGD
jgi:glutaredoxin-dependent peroxiredoxin